MQETNSYPIYQRGQQNTDLGRDDGSCLRKTSVASTTVLIIAGISTGAVSRGLNHAAALSSPNGITLTVFDSLAHLPNYSETLENQRLPRPVAALRDAAIEAHAAMVLPTTTGTYPPRSTTLSRPPTLTKVTVTTLTGFIAESKL